jgi:hypothetical protein
MSLLNDFQTLKVFNRETKTLCGEIQVKGKGCGICPDDLQTQVKTAIGLDYTVLTWKRSNPNSYAFLAQCKQDCLWFDAIVQ